MKNIKIGFKILICLTLVIFFAFKTAADNRTVTEYIVFTKENVRTEDMRKKSQLDEQKLTEYMKKFPSLSGIEQTLLELQEQYNINALLILAIIRLESGNGKSNIAQTRNNLGGFIGWERSVRVFKSFDSREECLIYMANLLSEHYLTDGGRFYSGYTLSAISKRYSEEPENWTDLVAPLILEIQAGIENIKI